MEQKYYYTCARVFCFLVIPVWSIAVRFVAGVGASPKSAALIELSLARAASACRDAPILTAATSKATTHQHLFPGKTTILGEQFS